MIFGGKAQGGLFISGIINRERGVVGEEVPGHVFPFEELKAADLRVEDGKFGEEGDGVLAGEIAKAEGIIGVAGGADGGGKGAAKLKITWLRPELRNREIIGLEEIDSGVVGGIVQFVDEQDVGV